MTPYYEADGIAIYHGDARAVLPSLAAGSIDLVLTDPPYPGLKGGMVYLGDGVAARRNPTTTVGVPWEIGLSDWLPDAWRIAGLGLMTFCSHHNAPEVAALLPSQARVALVTWYRRNSPPAQANVPRFMSEFIWLFKKQPGLKWRALTTTVIDIPSIAGGCVKTERETTDGNKPAHPTQKPTRLLKTLLSVGGATVLDPFAGTGTTLLAAKQLGQRCIGVELEERYCEIAARRLSQGVLPLEVAR